MGKNKTLISLKTQYNEGKYSKTSVNFFALSSVVYIK